MMFAPLTAEEATIDNVNPAPAKPRLIPILPVPESAPYCDWRHPIYGAPVRKWPYEDADGKLLAYSARVEYVEQDGTSRKEFFPLTYCRVDDGERSYIGWRACGVP